MIRKWKHPWEMTSTCVNLIELADNVQSDLRKLVLEEMEEKRKKVFDGGLLPEQRCKATYLGGKGRPDVL